MTIFLSSRTINRFFFGVVFAIVASATSLIIAVNASGDAASFGLGIDDGVGIEDSTMVAIVAVVADTLLVVDSTADGSKSLSQYVRISSEFSALFHLNAPTTPNKIALPAAKLVTDESVTDDADVVVTVADGVAFAATATIVVATDSRIE
jgi:hypothetical protein